MQLTLQDLEIRASRPEVASTLIMSSLKGSPFKKPKVKTHFRFLNLPVELQLEIINNLQHNIKALASLSRTCRTLHGLIEEVYFRRVYLEFRDLRKVQTQYAELFSLKDDTTNRRLSLIHELDITYQKCWDTKTKNELQQANSNQGEAGENKENLLIPNNDIRKEQFVDIRDIVEVGDVFKKIGTGKGVTDMIVATVVVLMAKLPRGQLKEFTWDMKHLGRFTPRSTLIKKIQTHHPELEALNLRLPKAKNAHWNAIARFNCLRSLTLRLGTHEDIAPNLIRVLEANKDTLERLRFEMPNTGIGYCFGWRFNNDFDRYKLLNNSSGFQLAKLRSLIFDSNADTLFYLTRQGLVDNEQIKELDISVYDSHLPNIFFPRSDYDTMDPRIQFPNLVRLRIRIMNGCPTTETQAWALPVLQIYLGLTRGLREFILEGIQIPFDLNVLLRHGDTIKKIIVTSDIKTDFYALNEVEKWANMFEHKFGNLIGFVLHMGWNVIFRNRLGGCVMVNRVAFEGRVEEAMMHEAMMSD